jgi:hypothetical protein
MERKCDREANRAKQGDGSDESLLHVDGLLCKGESGDESANPLIRFTGGNVTCPYWSGNTAIFVAHTVNAISSVCLGQMEIANVGGEFFFRASVWAVRHSKNGIDGFDAGL